MSFHSLIQDLKSRTYTDLDGDPLAFEFLPGLSPEAIQAVQKRWCQEGYPLPKDLIELLSVCSGIDCPEEICFAGRDEGQSAEYILPNEIQIALDGFGNSWNIYPSADQDELSHVFYVCHDPPVLVYQCHGLETFLRELAKGCAPPHDGQLREMMDATAMRVYEQWKDLHHAPHYRNSDDVVLRSFAQTLPDQYRIKDMRDLRYGVGIMCPPGYKNIPWPQKAPGQWIIATPDQFDPTKAEPKKGFLSKLFGK